MEIWLKTTHSLYLFLLKFVCLVLHGGPDLHSLIASVYPIARRTMGSWEDDPPPSSLPCSFAVQAPFAVNSSVLAPGTPGATALESQQRRFWRNISPRLNGKQPSGRQEGDIQTNSCCKQSDRTLPLPTTSTTTIMGRRSKSFSSWRLLEAAEGDRARIGKGKPGR